MNIGSAFVVANAATKFSKPVIRKQMTSVPTLKILVKDPKRDKPKVKQNMETKCVSTMLTDLLKAKETKQKSTHDHINKMNKRNIESKLLQVQVPKLNQQV